jgi:hypothetical protein
VSFTAWDISACCCSGVGCSGQVCVNVKDGCTGANKSGASVSLSLHSGGAVGSCSTDGSGNCCIPITADDFYDLTISAGSCGTKTLSNQHYTCTTNNVNVTLYCGPSAGVTTTVTGCYGYALPGASVSVTGPASFSGTTDGSGNYTFYPTLTGNYTITVTDSPKFNSNTSTVNVANLCSTYTNPVSMAVAAGYTCCAVQQLGSSPYPIANTLTYSDSGGSASVAGACGTNWCRSVAMPHASASPVTCCGGGGICPPTIGTANVPVNYNVSLANPPGVTQSIPLGHGIECGGWSLPIPYQAACVACLAYDTWAIWRNGRASCPSLSFPLSYAMASYTVNSWNPFSITFTFTNGNGLWTTPYTGPGVPTMTGEYFSSSLTVSE